MRLSLFAVAAALALATSTLAASSESSLSLRDVAVSAEPEFTEVVDDDGTVIKVFADGGDPLGDADEDLDTGAGPARRSTHKQIAVAKRSKKTKAMAGHFTIGPCGDGSWSPNNNDHIGAVMAGWEGGPKCGEFVQICNPNHQGRCVMVRVVDKCAACKEDAIDLTQSAFRLLSPSGTLDEGRIHGIAMLTADKPTKWNYSLFGPVKLN